MNYDPDDESGQDDQEAAERARKRLDTHRHGAILELRNIQSKYSDALPWQQSIMRSTVRRLVADVPDDALMPDLRSWLSELRRDE